MPAITMYALSPFEPSHAPEVLTWVSDARDLRRWCGRDDYPLRDPGVLLAWHTPDVTPYVLRDEARLLGYGELWVDTDERETELGRLIVTPDIRGRGVGRRLVSALVERARDYPFDAVYLRVLPDNAPALRCYRAAGFEPVTGADNDAFNRGQRTRYAWMRFRLGDPPPVAAG